MPMPVTSGNRAGALVGGKYRLGSLLGEGGMGEVYAAHHERLDRRVAVKFLHPRHAHDPDVVSRFFVEARAAARLKHPNVVEIHDVDRAEDGSVYMVLEFLEGEPLSGLLERRGRLPPAEAVALLAPVLDALERAHQSGIVHRDLKPENIYLSRERGALVPKVLDFGLAKLADGASSGATVTGTIVGTPAYMSPEQAMGRRDVGPSTDIWSMGVVLFECFTGHLPFDLEPDMPLTAIVLTIVSNDAHPLARFWPDAPEHLRECVDRALAKEPGARWSRMLEMKNALEGSPLAHAPTVLESEPRTAEPERCVVSASTESLSGETPASEPSVNSMLSDASWAPPRATFGARPLAAVAGAAVVLMAAIGFGSSLRDGGEPAGESTASVPASTEERPVEAAVTSPRSPPTERVEERDAGDSADETPTVTNVAHGALPFGLTPPAQPEQLRTRPRSRPARAPGQAEEGPASAPIRADEATRQSAPVTTDGRRRRTLVGDVSEDEF